MRKTATKTKTEETLFEVAPEQPKDQKVPAVQEPKPAKAKRNEVAKVERFPAPKPDNLITSLWGAITDPAVEPSKVTVLRELRESLMREQAHVAFMTAYIEMQAELPSISRDGTLDQGTTNSGKKGVKARWATFENINATVRPILVKHKMGLLLLPDTGADGTGIVVRGQLGFVCETDYGKIVHVEKCTIPVPNDPTGGKSPPQGVGSALSYGKRYGAIALLNIVSHAPDDRDTDARPRKPDAPAKIVSEKQAKELEAAITDCGVPEETFCSKYGIEKIADLPEPLLAEALSACRSFKANREKTQQHG